MRACWLKWVGRDWSISADYIWLNYSGANNIGLHFRIVSIEPRGKEPPVEAMINMVLTQM